MTQPYLAEATARQNNPLISYMENEAIEIVAYERGNVLYRYNYTQGGYWAVEALNNRATVQRFESITDAKAFFAKQRVPMQVQA